MKKVFIFGISGTFLALFCLVLELMMALKDQKSTGILTDDVTIIYKIENTRKDRKV